MNAPKGKLLVLLGVVTLGLIVLAVSIEPFLSRRINRVALTRHAIEQCEQVEHEVISGIGNGGLQPDLQAAFRSLVMQSKTFREGYVKVSEGVRPVVLDAWKQPLQMIRKSTLVTLSNVSPRLLSKTNAILIWSSGPNRSNEFGGGDDIFLLPPNASK
jgi:hypothetical protein